MSEKILPVMAAKSQKEWFLGAKNEIPLLFVVLEYNKCVIQYKQVKAKYFCSMNNLILPPLHS